MVATISYLNEPKAAAAVMHAYNRWMLDDWGFNLQDRIYSAPLVSLEDWTPPAPRPSGRSGTARACS
jgi:hypothetical protein